MTKATVKSHVLFRDCGWCNAVNPRRFAKRHPHLRPITIVRETTSVRTVGKVR